MNDRIPGTTYDNPIWYKGYRICLSDMYNVHGYQYDFVHDSYDGAEDAGDNRCGQGHTVEDCQQQIDEKEDE